MEDRPVLALAVRAEDFRAPLVPGPAAALGVVACALLGADRGALVWTGAVPPEPAVGDATCWRTCATTFSTGAVAGCTTVFTTGCTTGLTTVFTTGLTTGFATGLTTVSTTGSTVVFCTCPVVVVTTPTVSPRSASAGPATKSTALAATPATPRTRPALM